MNAKHCSGSPLCLLLVLSLMAWARVGQTQNAAPFSTLYNFTGVIDGFNVYASLVQASDGNFYGTTANGGNSNLGTVFQMTPSGALTTLYSFGSLTGDTDGAYPYAGLVQASDGDLYGTTQYGGVNESGTIFKITTFGTLTTLYSFSAVGSGSGVGGPTNSDGDDPQTVLIQASDGNLYGTATTGGIDGEGTVFQVTTSGSFTTVHSFSARSTNWPYANSDGANPAGVIQGKDGNLYGTATRGGANGTGTIYQITPSGTLTTLYSFSADNNGTNADGEYPNGLIQATDGNLYGTTTGGANFWGTVFKITTGGTLTTLHRFSTVTSWGGTNTDGANPRAGLIQGKDGNLYGTASAGGTSGTGTLFEILPSGTFTTLQDFAAMTRWGANLDGANPYASLIQGADGAFYATMLSGGYYGYGTIFRLGPIVTLVSLSPASVQANTAFTLTLNGFGFVKGAVVVSSEAPTKPLKTTFVRSSQLTAAVPLSANVPLSSYPGNVVITVVNPDGSKSSANLAITVPPPVLTALNPKSLPAQSSQSTLTVTGNAFAPGAVVNWNGSPLTTTFVSPTKLTAVIPASDLTTPGTASVSVTNPQGGGNSQTLTFTVTAVPHLTLSVGTLTRSANVITVPVTLNNTGTADADTVQITSAVLNVTSTSTTLPVALGTVAAGGSASASLTYPGSAGTKGEKVTLAVSGAYVASGSSTTSTFKLSMKVTLP